MSDGVNASDGVRRESDGANASDGVNQNQQD